MIPSGVEVFVGLGCIDLRWSFDRLAGMVHEQMGREARSGALFVFFGRRRAAMKVLYFDGSGLCVFYKRLDRGLFRIPEALEAGATSITIDERTLDDLLEGIAIEAKGSKQKRASVH